MKAATILLEKPQLLPAQAAAGTVATLFVGCCESAMCLFSRPDYVLVSAASCDVVYVPEKFALFLECCVLALSLLLEAYLVLVLAILNLVA